MAEDSRSLVGKLAWVTGGGSGIGLACATTLARAGARVVLSGRNAAALERAVADLGAEGLTAIAAPLDVSDSAATRAVHDQIVVDHGPVEIAVCSAGWNLTERWWQELDLDGFQQVIDINLTGVARVMAAVQPEMARQGDGQIIVISSWAGWTHSPGAGAAYSASKTGLRALVDTFNQQQAQHGLRATHLCPGEVATPILQTRPVVPTEAEQALMLRPADVARAVEFVASSPSSVCINELVITPTANAAYRAAM